MHNTNRSYSQLVFDQKFGLQFLRGTLINNWPYKVLKTSSVSRDNEIHYMHLFFNSKTENIIPIRIKSVEL